MQLLDQCHEQGWSLYNGDTVEVLPNFPDNSIDLSVYSPPFESLYTYSPTERDLGNSQTREDFLEHYSFIIKEMLRITKPGRITAVHVADLLATLTKDGYVGIKDFSGDVIRAYIKEGWIFDARVPIDKNQQMASIRTHVKSLSMSQMAKDRTALAPALPDYILKFRKPGENEVPVCGDFNGDEWIQYANPVWPESDLESRGIYLAAQVKAFREVLMDRDVLGNPVIKTHLDYDDIGRFLREIEKLERQMELPFSQGETHPFNGLDRCQDIGAYETWYGIKETNVIQGAYDGREEKDERHICPLQLETIRRCIELWSNPGEIVLDPFVGVGSTVHEAVRNGRKGIGIELKTSWYEQAIKNVKRLEQPKNVELF